MNSNHSLYYEIRVRGHIPAAWMDTFADLTCTEQADYCGQVTCLAGSFTDPAALQGILNSLAMLRMILISVECKNGCQSNSR
jgi:hypothetical protein